MGREIRRVPLDFDWPMDKIWEGFLNPYWKYARECPHCAGTGLNPQLKHLADTYYNRGGDYRAGWQHSITQDEVQALVGGTCTLFQRMNPAGDMLRVCTNVLKLDGTRAIGTYIPAANPDGSPNPVIATVLKGETFVGRAFVVNQWCITAYRPICDENRNVVGVLYFGIPQEEVPELRQGIMDMVVGKTGYVFVLAGSGDEKGKYH